MGKKDKVLKAGMKMVSWVLLLHHLFISPTFGLLVGLAVWRLVVREGASRRASKPPSIVQIPVRIPSTTMNSINGCKPNIFLSGARLTIPRNTHPAV